MAVLNFDAFWRDHGAAKGLSGLGKEAKDSEGHVKRLSGAGPKLAGAFAGIAAAEVFHSFIDGARESARVSRVTENVIRTTGGAAHITADQVGDLAQSISAKTGADDETIQSGQNMLLTFTNVRNEVGKGNDVFNQASMSVTDMAAAMNNGEVTTDGVKAASIQLGKALNDPIKGVTALQKVGVSFTASQRDQIKALVQSGHTLEAQKIIIGEVNKEFGGTAAAAADPLQRMAVILGNIGEDVGTKLLPALNAGADVLASIPEPAYMAGAAILALAAGAIGLGKAIETVKSVHEATSVIYSLFTKRVVAAATAQGAEAVAADGAAASTTVAGDAAAAAGTKFGTMAARVGVVAGVIGAIQGAKFISEMTAGTVATDKLADSLTKVGQAGESTEFRHLFSRAGIGNFTVDAQSATEAMDNFAAESEIAFGQGFSQKAQRLLSFGAASAGASADIGKLDQGLAEMVKGGQVGAADQSFSALTARLRQMGFAQAEITAMFPQYTAAQQAAATAADAASKANARTNDVLIGTHSNANIASTALHGLAAAQGDVTLSAHAQHAAHLKVEQDLATLADRTLSLRGADRELAGAQADLTASIKTNGRTLNNNTTAGRANGDALDRVADLTRKSAGAHRDAGEPMRVYAQRVRASTDRLADEAAKAGMTRTAARKYAEAILAVPRKQVTAYLTPGAGAARAAAKGLAADIKNINGRVVTVKYQADGKVLIQARGTTATARAGGGRIPGWSPSKTADNIPLWGTAGEHMWSVDEVAAAGGHGAVEQLRTAARSGQLRLAAGGPVATRYKGSFAPTNIMSSFIDRWAAGAAGAGGGGGPIPGGAGVARWAPMMRRALAALGLSQSLLPNELRQIQTESGGNPNAVQGNIGDVNNASGDLAKGLLQIIGATYRAFHWPGTAWNVFDPWSNMTTSLNYQKHRYDGSIAAVIGHGHGYGSGTASAAPGWAWVGEHGRELVKFRGGERVIPSSRASSSGSGGGVNVTVNVQLTGSAVGFQDQIVDAVRGAVRSGRLNRAVLPGVA